MTAAGCRCRGRPTPGLGFGPTGATWLPQPSSYTELARDRQSGVDGSTLEMYKSALALRRAFKLGAGTLEWIAGLGDDVVGFVNGEVTVITNMGHAPVALPAGEVLMASGDIPGDGTLPADITVWMVAPYTG